jgi:hypothetical protein
MRIVEETTKSFVVRIVDTEFSTFGKITNLACLGVTAIILIWLLIVNGASIGIGLFLFFIALSFGVVSPIWMANGVCLGRQYKYFIFDKLTGKLAITRRQFIFENKIGECWLHHIKDIQAWHLGTSNMYGLITNESKIVLLGAVHIEIDENDSYRQVSPDSAEYVADRLRVFLGLYIG